MSGNEEKNEPICVVCGEAITYTIVYRKHGDKGYHPGCLGHLKYEKGLVFQNTKELDYDWAIKKFKELFEDVREHDGTIELVTRDEDDNQISIEVEMLGVTPRDERE